MTDTKTQSPSDAELMEVIQEAARGCAARGDGSTPLRVARAVLALWGAPSTEQEPVAWAVAPLAWSDPAEPNECIRYNHVTAPTVLGTMSIEWKGWKDHDSCCVYLDGEYLGVAADIEGAKTVAVQHLQTLAAGLLVAAPPTQPAEPPQVTQPMPDLTALTERGATAWAGVDAQDLRKGGVPTERKPLTDKQVDDLHSEANRGLFIEREDYFKAFRDAEAAHGIKHKEGGQDEPPR
jgi:hypothetical protein